MIRVFGLTAGICTAIFLNLPMLQWKTTIPMTIWGLFGIACVIFDLVKQHKRTPIPPTTKEKI